MQSPALYWRTVRHLRPAQIYGRLLRRFYRPSPSLPSYVERRATGVWVSPARRSPTLAGPETFRFLNETHDLAAIGWDDPGVGRLWRYNLHYFDDLTAAGADTRRPWHEALLRRWVDENPPAAGTGWEPYPTSLRIVNWIKSSLAGNALPRECVESLAAQANVLRGLLETHLLANHLFANAKALIFAGVFFEGDAADVWFSTGVDILRRELREQILADGGHFELSPMYHSLILEDLLDLLNLARAYPEHPVGQVSDLLIPRIVRMQNWLRAMTHPDGEISFFNDAATGIAPAPRELEEYSARLRIEESSAPRAPLTCLAESGYTRVEHDDAVAFLDVGEIGASYFPAHAHADSLTFELSLFGERVMVNTGVSGYDNTAARSEERGTAAHNSVVIDGADSSEVWGGFRVGRRAMPLGVSTDSSSVLAVSASHDGYSRLWRRCIHSRRWQFGEKSVTIADRIDGRFSTAVARFHLHPAVGVAANEPADGGGAVIRLVDAGARPIQVRFSAGTARIEPYFWHREFGVHEAAFCICVELDGDSLETVISWAG